MFPVNLQLFIIAKSRLELAQAIRFEAVTHCEAEERATQVGEEWVREDSDNRRYFTVAVRDV